jgi:hypothetical protein
MNPVGEPDAGNPHVRFDERGWETERSLPSPRSASTLPSSLGRAGFQPRRYQSPLTVLDSHAQDSSS